MKALLKKLHAVQSEVGAIEKDEKVAHRSYSYRYTSLNSVVRTLQPLLAKHKLVLCHGIEAERGVVTTLYDIDSEDSMEVCFPVTDVSMNNNPAQSVGSAISYGRRYNMACLFNLYGEDDDGNAMKDARPKAKPKKKAPPIKVMASKDFERFLAVLEEGEQGKADKALEAVAAKNYTWNPEQRKALEDLAIDPDNMKSKIPF